MKERIGYSVFRQLAIMAVLVGILLLVGHLAGKIREGYADIPLMDGAILVGVGLLFATLGTLGIRLDRMERKLGDQKNDRLDS